MREPPDFPVATQARALLGNHLEEWWELGKHWEMEEWWELLLIALFAR